MYSTLGPERWRRIRTVAERALEQPLDRRDAILDQHCGSDRELREAAVRVLRDYSEADDLPGQQTLASREVELREGDRVGAYRIDRELGRGSMGFVYLAHRADEVFAKTVAIKVMRFSGAALEAAFRHECGILGRLEHARIARLHDAGVTPGGAFFMVMEYVNGEALDIYAARVSLQEKLALFGRVADAVDYAHRQGVLHCDLKPRNILVNDEGEPRLLDFGIAAMAGDASRGLTQPYASPEQRMGDPVDERTDVYALGVLLDELLSGMKVPSDLASVARRAQAPQAHQRYESVRAMAADIERYAAGRPVEAFRGGWGYRLAKGLRRKPALGLIPAGIAAAALFFAWSRPAPMPAVGAVHRVEIPGRELFPNVSDSGRWLAFAGQESGRFAIWLQRAAGEEPRKLTTGGEGDDVHPAISPDERTVAFRSEREGGGVFLTGIEGGAVRKLTNFGYHPAWSPDGQWLAVTTEPNARARRGMMRRSRIWLVNVATAKAQPLTGEDLHDAMEPTWSPGGERLAFWGTNGVGLTRIYTMAPGGAPVTVVAGGKDQEVWNPMWSADGHFLYYISEEAGTRTLSRIAVDEQSGEARGKTERVPAPIAGLRSASLSRGGRRLAYTIENESQNIERLRFDPETLQLAAEAEEVTRGDRSFVRPRVSPDGRRLVFIAMAHRGLWISNADGTGLRMLEPGRSAFTPRFVDDTTVGYVDQSDGRFRVVTVGVDGRGRREWTGPFEDAVTALDWFSPDRVLVALANKQRMFFLRSDGATERYTNPAPPGHALAFANTAPLGGRRLARVIPLRDRTKARAVLVDMDKGALTDLGANAQDLLGLFEGERYVLYKDFKHALRLRDRRTGEERLLRQFSEDMPGMAISPDRRWIYFSRSRAPAEVWVAEMAQPF